MVFSNLGRVESSYFNILHSDDVEFRAVSSLSNKWKLMKRRKGDILTSSFYSRIFCVTC